MLGTRRVPILPFVAAVLAAAIGGCGEVAERKPGVTRIPPDVHQFAWVSARIARGAQPDSERAFRELSEAGIRTIISVDGARPDVETARKYGMRYVHIPFGYDGAPRQQQLELAKTARELEGPFYVHCHHGKHRGPAGAVLAEMALGDMTPAQAIDELRRAGTDPSYVGLLACVRTFEVPDEQATSSLAFAFPETAPVPPLAEAMAGLDRRWDGIRLAQAAGWKTPEDHPDIEPAHEALQIRELFTELGRTGEVGARPEDFRRWIEDGRVAATDLEDALRASPIDAEAANRGLERLKATCASCHGAYRNAPEAARHRKE